MLHPWLPRLLSWDDVDPAGHPLDSASVDDVVRSLRPARHVPVNPRLHPLDPATHAWRRESEAWAAAVTYGLAQHYGRWVIGWQWGVGESEFDGGPVAGWCHPYDSIREDPDETLDAVAEAVREWRDWLENLAWRFEAYPLRLADIDGQRILWERTARALILQVGDRTEGASGWYGHCEQVLGWYLTRWGIPGPRAARLVEEAVGGRFSSWCSPDPATADEIAGRLIAPLRPQDAAPAADVPSDHLARWLEVRATERWADVPDGGQGGAFTPVRDGAAEDFRDFDARIDPARAAGLLAALDLVRADAARGAVLDTGLLAGWQQHILATPQPPAFRTLPAFAKGGRERYGIAPDTRARLDACLAEAASEGALPLPARAARAYLDVCFFHPFDDGNARCAFLTLLFVLSREGAGLAHVGLLRRITVQAGVAGEGRRLAAMVARYLSESRGSPRHSSVAP
ncbi:Fic family protein [Actinacidiphila bryophytorum]|uniref:Fic family protein n=1 Tax=Actinacidiphila bryophytorum TaxID=1436133 RepID=UPI002176CEBA|nr:Fic family protein [Actinacidiphila bryophytorum]UWE10273.1 Fic family protein [Actinacidiphila bryophytorum]